MYLTRIPIDITHREGLRFLSSSYHIHAAVEASFAPDAVRSNDMGRILWRLDDPIGRSDCVWLYIMSPERPDCTCIVDQVGLPMGCSVQTKPYDQVISAVSAGQVWQFRLTGNPVRKALVDKGRVSHRDVRGTIQAHVTEEQQRLWLLDRAEAHGFRIMPSASGAGILSVSHRRRERFRRGEREVTLSTAQFDGVLEVVDTALFKRALGFGIGRAKGFGCGLLTIAPVAGAR